jgi:nitrile hydratase accessory protein
VKPPRTFDSPWESRAFGIARALSHSGALDYERFRAALVEEIHGETQRTYYEHWQTALERVLAEAGLVEPADLEARAEAHASVLRSSHHLSERGRSPAAPEPRR